MRIGMRIILLSNRFEFSVKKMLKSREYLWFYLYFMVPGNIVLSLFSVITYCEYFHARISKIFTTDSFDSIITAYFYIEIEYYSNTITKYRHYINHVIWITMSLKWEVFLEEMWFDIINYNLWLMEFYQCSAILFYLWKRKINEVSPSIKPAGLSQRPIWRRNSDVGDIFWMLVTNVYVKT